MYVWTDRGLGQVTAADLARKLKHFSFLPHSTLVSGKNVPLDRSVMDPGFYDGTDGYRTATTLQECLKPVMTMERGRYRPIKVALVDLTKDLARPELAASFDHKQQVFAASVPKITTMLAAFQLRHDAQQALAQKGFTSLAELFDQLRDDWAATQVPAAGTPTPFARGVSLRGRLVLLNGRPIGLGEPRVPRLDRIFATAGPGAPSVEFTTTGQSLAQLDQIVAGFNKGKAGFRQQLAALGFFERMGICAGGDVPASNFATSTVVADLGFPVIASTLVQMGLHDPSRGGGLWLGADYWGAAWRGGLAGGAAQGANAGSLAAFLTLLAQGRLVSPAASDQMQRILNKVARTMPGTGSWFHNGLTTRLENGGSITKVFAKVGLSGGADDAAYIEREVDLGGGRRLQLRYVAVGLRAPSGTELEGLIRELDKCILANNGLTPAQGGHRP